jgi:hypothetical protein
MTFLRPEILTALILLALPIIVHLFEFRIFKPTAFSNLLFLENLKQEQHRYQKLKKWLILLLRLGYFTGIILAFALPTIPEQRNIKQDAPVYLLYLDNSFSTTAKGPSGASLLSETKEELYQWSKSLDGNQINWFTNDTQFPNQSINDFQQTILSLSASPRQLTPEQVALNAQRMFAQMGASNRHLIWFTDHQDWSVPSNLEGIELTLRSLIAADRTNICLEKASIDRADPDQTRLSVLLSNQINEEQSITIRVYKEDELFTQTGTKLSPGQDKIVDFDLGTLNKFKGMVTIEDRGLGYDDTLYFNVPPQPKVKVLSIGQKSNAILRSIFDENDFSYDQRALGNLDFSLIKDQNLIVLDQLSSINNALLGALNEHLLSGGGLVIIPEIEALETSEQLLNEFKLGRIISSNRQSRRVIEINAKDPFYKAIFEQNVADFQYPIIGQSFNVNTQLSTLLSFDQGTPYLFGRDGIYYFTGPITGPGTNFDQSPLSVITLIQLARQTQIFPELYYPTISESSIENQTNNASKRSVLSGTLIADQVVILAQKSEQIIPRQQQMQDYISVDFEGIDFNSGHYSARLDENEIGGFSFNHPRNESHGSFNFPESGATEIKTTKNMDNAMAMITQNVEGKQLWVWFAIFALICFMAEMFILKQTT